VNDPPVSCSTVDLTIASITVGSDGGLILTYWLNAITTNPVSNPTAVTAGTYYIKATNAAGCSVVKPVNVTVNSTPQFVTADPPPVCSPATVDLTDPSITAGSDTGLVFTYWSDANTSVALNNPDAVSASGTYYIRATAVGGCEFVRAVQVRVTIIKPVDGIRYPVVTAEENIPIQLNARDLGANHTYIWNPPVGLNLFDVRNPVFRYDQEVEYTIQIRSDGGCITIDTVLIVMRAQIPAALASDIFVPKAWSPNNDGHNDRLFPLTVNIAELKYFRIFNRWGQLVFETNRIGEGWNGIFKGQEQVSDVYTWTLEAVGDDGRYYKRAGNSVLLR
jgi:gliding motility-associated-like protein